jgi:hypothetical protein
MRNTPVPPPAGRPDLDKVVLSLRRLGSRRDQKRFVPKVRPAGNRPDTTPPRAKGMLP